MKYWVQLLCSSLFILFCFSCEKESTNTEDIIARVNDEIIMLEDFRLFYELDPNFGIDSSGYGALLDELSKFLDHKLAYHKAVETGLTEDSLFIKPKNWEKKQAMLRQLYRQKIERQIEITEEEIRQAFVRYNTELHVRHLFTKDIKQAQRLYDQLHSGATFELLAFRVFSDTLLANNGGDLGWIKAGELDENFADTALNLEKNEISLPIQTQWGYHIIQLLDRKEQMMLTESDFAAQRISLEKRIKQKKSQRLSNEFIANFMKNLNPQPVPTNFGLLWNAITPPPEHEKSVISLKIMFTNELIHDAVRRLRGDLEKPLIGYHGGQITIGEYLHELLEIPVGNRPRFQSQKQLSNQIGIWVRDKFLFEEARHEDLSDHPRVNEELQEFLEQQSYQYFLGKEIDKIKLPQEVKTYFEKREKNLLLVHPELERFHTIQEWIWYTAEKNLHESLKSIDADIEITTQKLREENKKINWDRRIRMFAIRKPS